MCVRSSVIDPSLRTELIRILAPEILPVLHGVDPQVEVGPLLHEQRGRTVRSTPSREHRINSCRAGEVDGRIDQAQTLADTVVQIAQALELLEVGLLRRRQALGSKLGPDARQPREIVEKVGQGRGGGVATADEQDDGLGADALGLGRPRAEHLLEHVVVVVLAFLLGVRAQIGGGFVDVAIKRRGDQLRGCLELLVWKEQAIDE